jgi:acyl-CoA thioesterase I
MKEIKIVFFGDSICYGQGISINKGWIPKIAEKLDVLAEKYQLDITVTNAGVNGNTTRLALERMPYDIQSHNYDIVIIQFGMNDCNYWLSDRGLPRVSKKSFEANLIEIIERANNFGAQKIILNTNHPTTRNDVFPGTHNSYQESNEAYNSIIRNIKKERKDIVLADIEQCIKNMTTQGDFQLQDILLPDCLHLSLYGHELYFDFIYPIIETEVISLINR